MNQDLPRELPILTDVVELHATGRFPQPEMRTAEEDDGLGVALLAESDLEALQAAVVNSTMNLTDELLHAAARDIEGVLFERVLDRLHAALPDLVAAALRQHFDSLQD